jgi:hypothetical protein
MAGIWREAVIAGGLTGVSVRPKADYRVSAPDRTFNLKLHVYKCDEIGHVARMGTMGTNTSIR